MKGLKILALVLGSVWFFPVSCTTGLFAGTWLVALNDARDTRDGEAVHSLFSIVYEPRADGAPFSVISLRDQQRNLDRMVESDTELAGAPLADLYKAYGIGTFLMAVPAGRRDIGDSNFSYRVLEGKGDEQLVEVVEAYHDGDNTIWSRYRATRDGFTPLTSRMFYFGYSFAALPYAFGLGFVLYGIGRMMRRRIRGVKAKSAG